MNLVVDCGNTRVKFAVFKGNTLLLIEEVANEDFLKEVKSLFKRFSKIERAIASSVGSLARKDLDVIALFCPLHVVSSETKAPFKNSYATPQTLGVDRVALATAAFYSYPRRNVLVIDAGTCVTYEMLNDIGEYLGGAISPGIQMRYKALHQQTAKLPLLEKTDIIDFIGNSTERSMHSGVVNGICLEIDGVIHQYQRRFKDLTVILTGGDHLFLSKRLKNTIFANSKFLLEGLNYLLEYNKH